MTRVLEIRTSNRLIVRRLIHRPQRQSCCSIKDGHPAVPTCARACCRAQQQSRMAFRPPPWRREASWTAASTTAPSSQRRTTMRSPDRCRPPRADRDAPFRRGFTPPLTGPSADQTADLSRAGPRRFLDRPTNTGRLRGDGNDQKRTGPEHRLQRHQRPRWRACRFGAFTTISGGSLQEVPDRKPIFPPPRDNRRISCVVPCNWVRACATTSG